MAGNPTPRILVFRTNPYSSRVYLRHENCKLRDGKDPAEFTGPMIADEAKKFVRKNKLATKVEKSARVSVNVRATRELGNARTPTIHSNTPRRS